MTTTNDELKAAIERVNRLKAGSYSRKAMVEVYGDYTDDDLDELLSLDRYRLSEAYLATLAAREGEELPVDEEWLFANGLKDYGKPEMPISNNRCLVWEDRRLQLWMYRQGNGMPMIDNPTRGQVRKLLEALGIPAKEQNQ